MLDVTPFLLSEETTDTFLQIHERKEQKVESKMVWLLPYSLVLRHTVEEVVGACRQAIEPGRAEMTSMLRYRVILDLQEHISSNNWFSGFDISFEAPEILTLEKWIIRAKEVGATVFIAGIIFKP